MSGDVSYRALEAHLARWDARRRLEELLAWLPRALAIGLLPGLALALLARARPLLTAAEIAARATVVALLAAVVAALAVLVRRRSRAERARFADRRFGLRERAIAAVEIRAGQHDVPPALAARQLGDALAAANAIDVARQMPLRSRPADWLPAAVTLAALLLALALPNPQEALLRQQRAVAAAVAAQAAALTDLSQQIAADESLTPAQREALQQPLAEALAALSEPDVSQAEAVAALSGAEVELRRLDESFDHAAVSASLSAAADALSRSQAAGALAEALGSAQATTAANAAAALADSLPQMDEAARDELAESLAAAANELRPTIPDLAEQLDRAAAALAAGDTATAQEALGQTADALNAAVAAAQAARAAEQLGQARQAVASAGGAGESNAAQGDEQGQGAGQTGGDGQQGAGDGQGADGQSDGQGSATGGPSEGGGHVENVFVPGPVDLSGQGQDVELEVQCLGNPEACGPTGQQLPGEADRFVLGGGPRVEPDAGSSNRFHLFGWNWRLLG